MTRRKRTPEPAQPPKRVSFANLPTNTTSSSFQIPASLAKLSSLSASLARAPSSDTSTNTSKSTPCAEVQNSEIVKRAQALVESGPPRPGNAAGNVAAQQQKPQKELRWKTTQKEFPDEQTWVQPIANYATAGHARALQTKYQQAAHAAEVDRRHRMAEEAVRRREEAGRNGLVVAVEAGVGGGGGGSVGAVQYPQIVDPKNSAQRYQVRMDGRVTLIEPRAPAPLVRAVGAGGVNGNGNGNATTADGSAVHAGKKRKHGEVLDQTIEFIDRHQRDFPSQQIWVRPPPPKPRPGAGNFTGQAAAYGEGILDLKDIETRRRATIANLTQNTDNAPAGPVYPSSAGRGGYRSVNRSVSLGSAQRQPRQDRVTSSPSQNSGQPPPSGPPPAPRSQSPALEYSKDQERIADLIAKKRAANEASGQQQRLLQLGEAHRQKLAAQRQNHRNTMQGQAFFGGGPVFTHSATSVPPPLVHFAAAARESMTENGDEDDNEAHREHGNEDENEVDRNNGDADRDSGDEDAPGEDDEGEGDTSPVRESIEDASNSNDQNPNPDPQSHLVTDPGDLGSLFSSRGATPPQQPQTRTSTRNGRTDAHSNSVYYGNTGAGSGYEPAQADAAEDDEPMSPSAQLLMALANATPPPSWEVPAPAQQQRQFSPRRTRRG